MNYLAHFALAGDLEEHRIGSFLGDFVKGSLKGTYGTLTEQGIRQHRLIDSFTDQHPLVTRSRLRLGERHRRHSGIAIDLLFDHFLATRWDEYYSANFTEFCDHCYSELEQHQHRFPERAQTFSQRMLEHRILHSYHDRGIINLALERVSLRLRDPQALVALIPALEECEQELSQDFHEFYPLLQQQARQLLDYPQP